MNFEEAIRDLDTSLFDRIVSQSTEEDRRSMLACQLATRDSGGQGYRYLEIGSYLGGSLQPYLLDERCVGIYSIDKRPSSQPDARGTTFHYEENSTERMLRSLRDVSEGGLGKLVTIDGSTEELDPSELGCAIDICFIDGEHTDNAVFSDFRYCLGALAGAGAIVFHDASITYNGISRAVEYLGKIDPGFRSYGLPNDLFVLETGDCGLHRHEKIHERLVNNAGSFLYVLQQNDRYRRFANRGIFRLARDFVARMRGSNRCR